jgi:hypothetical protein
MSLNKKPAILLSCAILLNIYCYKGAIEIRCLEILGQQQTISHSHTIVDTVKITAVFCLVLMSDIYRAILRWMVWHYVGLSDLNN